MNLVTRFNIPALWLLLTASPVLLAQANNVVFIDGGYVDLCTSSAFSAEHPEVVEMTGSRLSIDPIEICTRAIEAMETTPAQLAGIYNNRGVLLFAQKRLEESLMDFDAALKVDSMLGAAHVNRGYTLVALKRLPESLPAFDRGIELGPPEPAKAYFNRGMAHEELGHVREAYLDYKKATELLPEWIEPQRELTRFSVKAP
jgi:tetratricopeptide (TPR) repeat protein